MDEKENIDEINEDLYAPFGNKEFKKEDYEGVKEEQADTEIKENTDVVPQPEVVNNEVKEEKEEKAEKSILSIEKKPEKTVDEQNEFDAELMKAYIGNGYESIATKKFNFAGFIFGGLYLMYRKYFFLGFFYSLIIPAALLTFSNKIMYIGIIGFICFILNLIIGIKFNKKYLEKTYRNIKKIENKNSLISDKQITNMCAEAGGTNLFIAVLLIILISLLIYVSVPELIKIVNKENNLNFNDLLSFIKNK